jgi:hypothetical protein
MAFSYSPKIVTDGLVLYLDAGNPYSYVSGSTNWNDLSRSQTNGTLTNGPTYNTGSLGSIVFDGTDDYVVMTALTQSLNVNYTVGVWAYPLAAGNTGAGNDIISKFYSANQPYASVGIEYFGTKFRFYASSIGTNFGSTPTTVLTSNDYSINNWYYLCLSYSNRNWFGYINGTQVVSSTNPNDPYWNDEPWWIGSWKGDPTTNNSFNGRVSSAQIYNRALSAQEVLQNYNATKTRFGL